MLVTLPAGEVTEFCRVAVRVVPAVGLVSVSVAGAILLLVAALIRRFEQVPERDTVQSTLMVAVPLPLGAVADAGLTHDIVTVQAWLPNRLPSAPQISSAIPPALK